MRDGGYNQTQFGKLIDASQPTVSRWLTGIRPEADFAERIDALWIHAHPEDGPGIQIKGIAVHGRIGAGAEVLPEFEQVPPEGLYEIEFITTSGFHDIAFEVVGDSMWPRYDDGDLVVCRDDASFPDQLVGAEAAIRTGDGKRYLKRIRKGSLPNRYTLESHNAPPIENVEICWAAEITHVARRNQWNRT